jgi:hypothetical protein
MGHPIHRHYHQDNALAPAQTVAPGDASMLLGLRRSRRSEIVDHPRARD